MSTDNPSDISSPSAAEAPQDGGEGLPVVAIEDLPKVSLHDHLDGGLRPGTIVELAAGIDHELPTTDPQALGEWFFQAADSGTLELYLETFAHTTAVMQSAANLTRVAREFAEDLAAENVVYAEVRWAPEQHLAGGLNLDAAVEAVQRGFDQAMEAAAAQNHVLVVMQLLCAMRQNENSLEIAELALRHRDAGVVGFDLAGPEEGFLPRRHKAAFDLLAENFMPVTVHAGEGAGMASIESALVDGRALRLGHGVRLAEDIQVSVEEDIAVSSGPERGGAGTGAEGASAAASDAEETATVSAEIELGRVAEWVLDRGITLEVCPTSNLQTGAAAEFGHAPEDHPVDLLVQAGFNVVLGPDNRLMSGSSVSSELAFMVDVFGYDFEDVLELTLNGVRGAFVSQQTKDALAEHIEEEFQRLVSGAPRE